MKGVVKFKDVLKEDLKNPEIKQAFNEEEIYADVAIQVANLREKKGFSQRELARRLHTTQQTVSRLECPNNKSYSLKTLVHIAQALDTHLKIQFV